jgi:hypothetical protein
VPALILNTCVKGPRKKYGALMAEPNKTFFDYQCELGVAVWLFLLYWHNHSLDDDSEWMKVARGEVVRDEAAASHLGVSVHTVIRWCRRLVGAGLIRARSQRRGGFHIWVRNLNRPELTQSSTVEWPEIPTAMLQ